mmetsp:Transcript_11572/g.17481  ORF Transcript_11572/g.17481 Transcript_11572/m.17481 type:complete len:82 (+) Transcript_11572:2638-2883(+)
MAEEVKEEPKPQEKVTQPFWDQPPPAKIKEEPKKVTEVPAQKPQQSAIFREDDDDLDELEDMFVSKPVTKPRAAPVSSKAL